MVHPSTGRRIRRSRILVPANVDRMVEKAHDLESDVVLLDLQDAIPSQDEAKRHGRNNAAAALKGGGFRARELTVRVNDVGTPWFLEDVPMAVRSGADSIMLPHVSGLRDILFAEGLIKSYAEGRRMEILFSIERPSALYELKEIAQWSELVSAVSLGPADFALEMGSRAFVKGANRGSEHVAFAKHSLLLTARAKGWNATDSVSGARPDDLEGVRAAMVAARDLGFDGASVLYPKHLPIANDVYGVPPEELTWANDVIAAYESREEGRAVTTTTGSLVLPAHYECACQLRDFAEALNESSKES